MMASHPDMINIDTELAYEIGGASLEQPKKSSPETGPGHSADRTRKIRHCYY